MTNAYILLIITFIFYKSPLQSEGTRGKRTWKKTTIAARDRSPVYRKKRGGFLALHPLKGPLCGVPKLGRGGIPPLQRILRA
jgi:hypothetical protein